jgi:hypothetical protein
MNWNDSSRPGHHRHDCPVDGPVWHGRRHDRNLRLSTASGNNPQALAHGISVALYNTGFGLIIAIPAMIFYRHFRAQVDGFLVEMEQEAVKLVELMQGERK